ncbi:GAF domain-containing protein [Moorena sp. SIO4G3]|uniref:GAF domain-containing protein n=1 Tax=Moorena sp. SIO4G3 TaxID=2607821 RepID=UPI001428E30B|nr:GAF domain-containing protein [Moorena sp. SIO4G3]NEO81482.1 GAF domain-containing protein [Moorena sp. SIO4G3]
MHCSKDLRWELPVTPQGITQYRQRQSSELTDRNNSQTQRKSNDLRTQLLKTILPAVLTPLGLAGLFSYSAISRSSQQQAEQLLEGETLVAGRVLYIFLEEAKRIPATLAASPLVVEAASTAAKVSQVKNLAKLPYYEVEDSFSATRLIQPNQALNYYLHKTTAIHEFVEISFTEKHGFNVAYNTPTHDFVQRDEAWWQVAKNNPSQQVMNTRFDDTNNRFVIDFSKAITDPATDEFLGVVRGVLPASVFSTIFKNLLKDLEIGDSQYMQLLALKKDDTVAVVDTIYQGKSQEQPQKLLGAKDKAVVQNLKILLEAVETGKTVQQKGLTIKSANSPLFPNLKLATFDHNTRHYIMVAVPDSNWTLAVSIKLNELRAAGRKAAIGFTSLFVVLGIIITLVVRALSDQLAKPLGQLANTAKAVIAGNLNVQAELLGATETQLLAQVFNNLVTRIKGRLQEQEQETEQARTLVLVSNQLQQSLNFDNILQTSVYGLHLALKTDGVFIYRFNPDFKSGIIAAEVVDSGLVEALGQTIYEPITTEEIQQFNLEKLVSVENLQQGTLTGAPGQFLQPLGVVASLVAPIIVAGELFGLLYANHCSEPHRWQESERHLMKELTRQIGDALTQALLLEQQQATVDISQTLNEITASMLESLEREKIFAATVLGIKRALSCDRTIIYLLEQNQKGSMVGLSVTLDGSVTLETQKEELDFPLEDVDHYQSRQVLAIDNLEGKLTYYQQSQVERLGQSSLLRGAKASLVAPILVAGKLIGFLAAHQCSQPRAWQETEINLLTQVAIQFSFALKQANLLEKTERISQEQRQEKEALQKQLLVMLKHVQGAAQGDLTVRSDVTLDEIGKVADGFNTIIESLQTIVTQVNNSAVEVNTLLENNEVVVGQLAEDALKQASETTRTLDSVEQITDSIQAVAEHADQAARVVDGVTTTVEASSTAINLTQESILELRDTIGETTSRVKQLGKFSEKIAKVVALSNMLKVQTNVLTINTEIEAARSGGIQGFVVIAKEVNQLTNQLIKATQEIHKIVDDIDLETSQLVKVMEQSTAVVEKGTSRVEEAKQNMKQLRSASCQIEQLVTAISQGSLSQTETTQSVAMLIKEMAQFSERTVDSSRQISSSLTSTVAVAQELQESVSGFKDF